MNQTKRWAAAMLAALLSVGMAQANPYGGGPGGMGHEGGMHKGGGQHGPGHADLNLHGIKLTDQQQDQLFKLKHNAEPVLHEKRQALRKSQESLREASGFSSYNPARVRQLAEQQGKLMADLLVLQIELKHKAFALLTSEQQKQVLEREQRRGERGQHEK